MCTFRIVQAPCKRPGDTQMLSLERRWLQAVAGRAALGVENRTQRAAARVGAVDEIAEPVDRIDQRQVGAGASQLTGRLERLGRIDRASHVHDPAAAGPAVGHSAN
jgi:hypothetical protein